MKSGSTLYGCPRCWTLTTNFYLPIPKNTKSRTSGFMEFLVSIGEDSVLGKAKKESERFSKEYSIQIVRVSFISVVM